VVTVVTGDEFPALLEGRQIDTVQRDFEAGFRAAILEFTAAARADQGYPSDAHA